MNLLALDTSTEQLFLAVQRGGAGAPVLTHDGPGGAQASATLVPAVLALLARAGLRLADLDAIAFGAGPGSFTGLRTACAVAQGLGHGAGVPLLPVDTLLAVAEDARWNHGLTRVLPVLDARMDEVYTAAWAHDGQRWQPVAALAVGKPETVVAPAQGADGGWTLAGNAFAAVGERLLPGLPRVSARPAADALLRLAPALLAAGLAVPAAQALPRYIRDKVAQTTAEREALKAVAVRT